MGAWRRGRGLVLTIAPTFPSLAKKYAEALSSDGYGWRDSTKPRGFRLGAEQASVFTLVTSFPSGLGQRISLCMEYCMR